MGLRAPSRCCHLEVLTLATCAKALLQIRLHSVIPAGDLLWGPQFSPLQSTLWPPKFHVHPMCQAHSPPSNIPEVSAHYSMNSESENLTSSDGPTSHPLIICRVR